jgi:lycopene beta-cyclase
MTPAEKVDYAIIGGGLQGCLLAHALACHQPGVSVLLIERAHELCGNHTWSFHQTDVPDQARDWFDPLVTHRWPGYSVRFPGLSRRLGIPYATISSAGLRAATRRLTVPPGSHEPRSPGSRPLVVLTGTPCEILSPTRVRRGDGAEIDCGAVIDCRGRAASPGLPGGAGYQTFIGHEYRTGQRWPVAEPTVMDVREDQSGGFEFLYELPFGHDQVLLEYTRFHEEPTCDESRAVRLISARLAEAGVRSAELIRTERGCLPMPYAAPSRSEGPSLAGGYAGGWYHAATGYSMPLAIRFADLVARSRPERLVNAVERAVGHDALRRGFARFLNRLLFCLVMPEDRWQVFRRFYGVLPEDRIARFYGHRFSAADAARIILGRPPTRLAPLRFARSFFPLSGQGFT